MKPTAITSLRPRRRHLLLGAAAVPLAQWVGAVTTDDTLARHVLNRLAWGPRPGDLARVQAMGWQAYVNEQLAPEALPQPALDARLAALQTTSLTEQVQAYRQAVAQSQAAKKDEKEDPNAGRRDINRTATAQAVQTWLLPALESPRQLHAVMTDFWFNHFNVFIGKNLCRVLMTDYLANTIAPHAMGNFRTLLGATAQAPAMLVYLDNWMSSAANAPQRRGGMPRRAAGLNENYARELMELHTLGVDGGYTQADVTELARVFTGWTIGRGRRGDNGLFQFDAERHDSGPKTWLGQPVPDGGKHRGMAQGQWALDVLARHPSTAQRIAFKLAQHFVADTPDAALVKAVAARFKASDGDIRATLRTLFEHPAFTALEAIGSKFKTPQRFAISLLRATATPVDEALLEPLVGGLRVLGQAPLSWPTPEGHKPTRAAWLDPEALARRADLATRLAQRTQLGAKPTAVPELLATLGSAITPRTRTAVAAEPQRLQAALLLASPDFQDT